MSGYPQSWRIRRGLTLIETLTVLFIVGILVAFVTGLARHASRTAETRRAQADLQVLADALERYCLRYGDYPLNPGGWHAATNLLAVAVPLPGGEAATGNDNNYYFSHLLPQDFTCLDPWGGSYLYYRHSRQPAGGAANEPTDMDETFRLRSLGPDRMEETSDDIVL
ncbi:MAG: type II secretion system protein GspG [Kiritimatiellae bacterium]|nr:type II secretion system protein GspG [Kiritimatiellia bacterium]